MAAEQPAASCQQQFIAAAAAASQRCKDYGYRAEVPQQADSSAKRYMSFVNGRVSRWALLVYLLKAKAEKFASDARWLGGLTFTLSDLGT